MSRNLPLVLLAAISASTVPMHGARADSNSQASTPTIRVTTHLVMVNVVATDKAGKPITDLKPGDFTLEDQGKKQKLALFSLERPGTQPSRPQLPPGIYSNKPDYYMPAGPLTVLLLDALNTPFIYQAQARLALIKYAAEEVKHHTGNHVKFRREVALYALGTRLYRLQNFTNDPSLLQAAIRSYSPISLPEHASTLQPSSLGSGAFGGVAAAASARQIMAEQASANLQLRIEATLGAMRALALQLAGHPGRKNLVWLTAGFPISMVPENNEVTYVNMRSVDPTAHPPLPSEQTFGAFNAGLLREFTNQVRRTSALLSQAQISIYPVDVRGLIGPFEIDASNSGRNSSGFLMLGNDFGAAIMAGNAAIEASQASMQDLADQTGGRVFKNQNDIAHFVAEASSDGDTYYALGYYPSKEKFDNSFHKLKITVSRAGVRLRYRSGYFALDPGKLSRKQRDRELAASLEDNAAQATMVLFDARVVLPAPAEEATVPVQFLVQPDSITMQETKNGGHELNLDFYVAAFNKDGKLAANLGKRLVATLNAGQFDELEKKGLLLPVNIKLPPGSYSLRLAVRDNSTGYIGNLSIALTLAAPRN